MELFAQRGFSGASTRAIARRAQVNEASVYRYFASKRALFTAGLEKELQSVRGQIDGLRRTPDADTPRQAIRHLFRLIADIVSQRPELMRLLQFSALEFGAAMKPVYRKHLAAIINAARKPLQRWSEQQALPHDDAETIVLSFIATMVTAQSFYSLFARAPLACAAAKAMTETCAEVWCAALFPDASGRQTPIAASARGIQP